MARVLFTSTIGETTHDQSRTNKPWHTQFNSTYVNEHDVPGLAVLGDPPEGILNVLLGGGVGPSVVAQDEHLALVEALGLDQIVLNVTARGDNTHLSDAGTRSCRRRNKERQQESHRRPLIPRAYLRSL
jgi:hypothetical protein